MRKINNKGNMKGKHLTRSHAMRESTSPPRTPTPRRSEPSSQLSPNGYQQQQQLYMDGNEGSNYNNSNKQLHTQSSTARGNSPVIDTQNIIESCQYKQHTQAKQQQHHQSNVALSNEMEFPKLNPPKSKIGSTSNGGSCGGVGSGSCSNNTGSNNNSTNSQQRINSSSEGHSNNNNATNNYSNGSNKNSNTKKTNIDEEIVNETYNKITNNAVINAGNTNNKFYQSQQQQLSAGNALQKALNICDNAQSTAIYNSSMKYQVQTDDINHEQHSQPLLFYEKQNRCPRNDSRNSINSNEDINYEAQHQQQQNQSQHHQRSGGGKKHRTNSNSKGSKPRLKNMGSTNNGAVGNISNMGSGPSITVGTTSNSVDKSLSSSNNTSGFISRENSNEQYTDHGGTDLLSFFKDTLNKNVKDRQFLLKIEKDLIEFVQEGNRGEVRFPQASSYNRMLIHRTAAFFGMEHNVDSETQQCVIVAQTKNTRIPEIRFKALIINSRDDSRKSILKRDTHSFDEVRQSSYLYPDRSGMLDRKAKSFEEQEEDYDRARSRIFNRDQSERCPVSSGCTDDDNFISWTNSVNHQQISGGSGKVSRNRNSTENRCGVLNQKSNSCTIKYGASNLEETSLLHGESPCSNKNSEHESGILSKPDSAANSWRLSHSSSGTVYQYEPLNKASGANVSNNLGNIYHSNQNNLPQQQLPVQNAIKKTLKQHQVRNQFNKMESTTTGCESVAESSTQTANIIAEEISSQNTDIDCQEGDLCKQHENNDCDKSANGCLSITTTTSTKNYDRIEVQKFKNQATSPNISINESDEILKKEIPMNVTPTQQTHLQHSQTLQQSQTLNRETPHSSRSTSLSNSDILTKRSSEEPKGTSWAQSYQASDGSTLFLPTSTTNSTSSNPYCSSTYQQGSDGSIYAVPHGMIYTYPQQLEGEFQGYLMPVFDSSQQRSDTAAVLQPSTQAIFPTGGAATMVPIGTYPTAQFTATNGPHVYPSQVIYSGEQFQTASAPLAGPAQAAAAGQLQQIPMTTYPIGYAYPYNGYWGQTMAYYIPQQALPSTSLIAAAPLASVLPGGVSHVAGGVSPAGPNGGNTMAGPSTNSSSTINITVEHAGNSSVPHTIHQNSSVTTGYQAHLHTVGSSHSSGTTYYGTGRIKRPTPPHFNSTINNSGQQIVAATSIANGVTTATYQLGHAVPTLTIAASATTQATAGPPTTIDLNGNRGAPTTATMYALPQHGTIFPTNVFPYTTNAAAATIVPQTTCNSMAPHTAVMQTADDPHGHIRGTGPVGVTTGAIHDTHHSNAVITPLYTTSHHHTPHPGIQSGGHTIHAPGPSAIPIVDPATITNVTQHVPTNNTITYCGRIVAGNTAGTSQSAPSTPHSMLSSSNLQHSQRNSSAFSTPPIMANNGCNFHGSSSAPQYYASVEMSHQSSMTTPGGHYNSNAQNSFTLSSYEKRNNGNSVAGKKPISYQSASLFRQNSTSVGGYNNKPNNGANNNDTRASSSSSTNSRQPLIKRVTSGVTNDKPQAPLLSGPPNFVSGVQDTSANSYQTTVNADICTGNNPIVNVSKPPLRLNAAAAAFRQKGSVPTSGGFAIEYRRNTLSQRNSPTTNINSCDNSNNNSPHSIHNSSNGVTPIASACYPPSCMINAQNNSAEHVQTLPPSLYITTAPARVPAHIPPHLQPTAANGAAVPPAAITGTTGVTQQPPSAVLGGSAAASAVDVANAAAAAAVTVAHHHHHQPFLGTYNAGGTGLYFKYGHTYFAHPSVALPNSRRSPSIDLRNPLTQMPGMYPTVNMMIPAQPRHPGRYPNSNYKGSRPR